MSAKIQGDNVTLSLIALSFLEAWKLALTRLADEHDNQAGAWLDELEHSALQTIKSIAPDNLPVQEEAIKVSVALILMEEEFASFRAGLKRG